MFKLDLEKAEEPEVKLPTSIGSQEKKGNSKTTPISASLTRLKPLTVWITTNCGKYLEAGIPAHLTCLLRNLYTDKKQQLEPDMEQRTGSNLRKEYIKAVYCHPTYLTSLQSTSFKMPGWMNHKLEQDCWEEYQQSHICR